MPTSLLSGSWVRPPGQSLVWGSSAPNAGMLLLGSALGQAAGPPGHRLCVCPTLGEAVSSMLGL